jgi:hypothetical protein
LNKTKTKKFGKEKRLYAKGRIKLLVAGWPVTRPIFQLD